MPRYNPAQIEPKWQQYWDTNHTFRAPDIPKKEKIYVLDMFPYPSGEGLHVGHPEGYTATDIVCRFQRMRGKDVLHPMGFDAFGLPAEEHAIHTNTPPSESTQNNIATFRRQLKMLGFSYDWDRELATTDVKYFRWTQWIFLVLFDTWFDTKTQKGRPIVELPIPQPIAAEGQEAVRRYQDEHRLAYQADALVNWCPALGTVLANEEVQDGKSERGSHPVQRLPLRQWMLRITSYADRLEEDLADLDWSDGIKKLQSDWIGRSTGAEVDFYIGPPQEFGAWKTARQTDKFPRKPGDDVLRVFTTRPDTLFGATYMVLAPEHPFVERFTTPDQQEDVKQYCTGAAFKSDRERTETSKEKTGVFTGSFAINPVNGRPIPIWIADYVLISYGTGAIMAVPAHDTRDFEFADKYDLTIIAVVDPIGCSDLDREAILAGRTCSTDDGAAINSGQYNGQPTATFKKTIAADIEAAGFGRQAVNYKLRDWLFSRQRFWGEPFPILHEVDQEGNPTGLMRAVEPDQLPVNLPHLDDYKPHGRPEPPLTKAPDQWLRPIINGQQYLREANTMPQWAGSCWYYLRFIDPDNDQCFVDPEKERAWMPVDLYVGGAEHAVLHLLYARFWHKVLFDRGHVSAAEPFRRLVNQGMILGEMEYTGYRTGQQKGQERWVSADQIRKTPDGLCDATTAENVEAVCLTNEQVGKRGSDNVLASDPEIQIDARSFKMSKSRGNVVNPDKIVHEHGADSLRLYEMFMGPLEATKPWSMAGVNGVRNFLDRAWRMIVDHLSEPLVMNPAVQDVEPNDKQSRVLHRTIMAVTNDIERLEFNTAIARMMEFVNSFTKEEVRPKRAIEQFVLLLAPFAPHICEELWEILGHEQTLAYEPWPEYEEQLLKEDSIEIPVQIGKRVRAKVRVPADSNRQQLEEAARSHEKIAEILSNKTIVKVIVVPGRLVNFVVK